MKKLTNEIVDQRLIDKNIQRLSNYQGNKILINWKCLKKECGYIWEAIPNSILNNEEI